MVAYQLGWVWLTPIALVATLTQLPYLNERWKESKMICLPLFASVAGLTGGLLLNFLVGNFRLMTFAYCVLASVASYMVSVVLIILYRKAEAHQDVVSTRFEQSQRST